MTLQAGAKVRRRARPERRGDLTGKSREGAGGTHWQVRFPDRVEYVAETQLEVAPLTEDPSDLVRKGGYAPPEALRRTLIHRRLSGQLSNVLYSMEATNTTFLPYQFKPVLKLLASPSNGLLIADEVGLGKTIEAGLIWTELRTRFDAKKLLVVCPAALTTKWRRELSARFGVAAQIVKADELLEYLNDTQPWRDGMALICSLQGMRPEDEWDVDQSKKRGASRLARFLSDHANDVPLLNLVVVDEAHHMRNHTTKQHRVGQLLRDVTDYMVLLSATPVHNTSDDLLSALKLVAPNTYERKDSLDLLLSANRPLVEARDRLLTGAMDAQDYRSLLQTAGRHWLLEGNRQIALLLEETAVLSGTVTDPDRISRHAHILESVSLLSHAVTRTRKRDVIERRVVREPHAQRIPMSACEREFYDQATDAIRKYADQRDGTLNGILLATPQRQLASCMVATLEGWKAKEREIEDGEIDEEDFGPLVTHLARYPWQGVSLEELETNDSKFKRLLHELNEYLHRSPDEKVVVFSSFRGTLRYLERRLERAGIRCQVMMGASPGGRPTNKSDAIDDFSSVGGASVLLSSEVGAEGLDLEFCRLLINYDLPWNPMRVEQRIGRLDRIGQKSELISIWNMIHADTIDDRIYSCLYEKLKLCESALGDFESILGDEVQELTRKLASNLTLEQKERVLTQTAQALSNQRTEIENLERQSGHLIAHGEYVRQKVQETHDMQRWITSDDVEAYVVDALGEYFPGCELRVDPVNTGHVLISLSKTAKDCLDDYTRRHGKPPSRLADGGPAPVRCAFQARLTAANHRHVEVVSQVHPLTRMLVEKTHEADGHGALAVCARLRSEHRPADILPGRYVAVVAYWEIAALRGTKRLAFGGVRQGEHGWETLSDIQAERLVGAVEHHGEQWAEGTVIARGPEFAELVETAFTRLDSQLSQQVSEVEAVTGDYADLQLRTAESHLEERRVHYLTRSEEHRRMGRKGLPEAELAKLAKLEEKVGRQRVKLEEKRTVHTEAWELAAIVMEVLA